jgi:hypothetical protein
LSEFDIALEDSSPIVIGGIGGSGTRLVTQVLQEEGVHFGGDLNDELDNLWFSLLFVRRTIVLKPVDEVKRLVWLFINSMRKGLPIPNELASMLDDAAQYDRGPALNKEVLEAACASMKKSQPSQNQTTHKLWGWKQPNVQVLVPMLAECLPQMKYIYVVRNGLDIAFGPNQNQLKYFWGDLLLEGDVEPDPRNALRYWVASYKRNCAYKSLLGDRLYILDYDLLCREPVAQIEQLNRFLGLTVSRDILENVGRSVVIPASTGRHQRHDCTQLRSEDIDFVRAQGFDVLMESRP